MRTEHDLIALAHEAHSLEALRQGALALLTDAFDIDVGIFVTLDAHDTARTLVGVEGVHLKERWEEAGRELAPVKAAAMRDGVASDRAVLGDVLEATQHYREVMAPLGGTETLLLVPQLGHRPLGLVALGRCGGRFSRAATEHARALVPALSLACGAWCGAAPTRRPTPRLSASERDLYQYLALGHSTRQIAAARGTSFFTVRNQLSKLYRKLEVANRAEALGLKARV